MKAIALITAAVALAASTVASAEDVCALIRDADVKTGSNGAQMKMTGYSFASDTPKIYGLGSHSCSYLRDEAVNGEPAAVYREQFKSDVGSTDATIWISKASGRVLREEQDGDIVGKGKGHISYRWPSKG